MLSVMINIALNNIRNATDRRIIRTQYLNGATTFSEEKHHARFNIYSKNGSVAVTSKMFSTVNVLTRECAASLSKSGVSRALKFQTMGNIVTSFSIRCANKKDRPRTDAPMNDFPITKLTVTLSSQGAIDLDNS